MINECIKLISPNSICALSLGNSTHDFTFSTINYVTGALLQQLLTQRYYVCAMYVIEFVPRLCYLKEFQTDVETHTEIVGRLDRTGTYLKYYGAKHDAIVIRNQLLNIKMRWKRLMWKTDERGRLLNSAYKEDKKVSHLF